MPEGRTATHGTPCPDGEGLPESASNPKAFPGNAALALVRSLGVSIEQVEQEEQCGQIEQDGGAAALTRIQPLLAALKRAGLSG
ncbi:MAG: hypothetical protein HZA22_01805 [Nitrospirae bacterium]|nr:hypothetical protein [Nitrospirota bacterium]MBI5696872.1 hypothetical protein [Nitrospirota bacterium]